MTDEFPKITLKAARINAGYTQDGATHAIGKTKQTIVNWERGITEIKWKDLATLSELYQMPPEYLKMPDGN